MKRNDLYMLAKLHNAMYLVPTGQAVVDRKKAIKINETGAFLWKCLEEDITLDELHGKALAYYGFSHEEAADFYTDIDEFVGRLISVGAVSNNADSCSPIGCSKDTVFNVSDSCISTTYTTINIAGIKIHLYTPAKLVPSELSEFTIKDDDSMADLTVVLTFADSAIQTPVSVAATLETSDIKVYEYKQFLCLSYADFEYIKNISITRDYASAEILIGKHENTEKAIDVIRHEIFLSLRTPFLLSALKHSMVMLHSSSVLYNDGLLCFSAPAGTGKSTHAALWKDAFGSEIINGDLNLLKVDSGSVTVPGTPWCGTSKIYSATEYPLSAVSFLSRSDTNRVSPLNPEDSALKLLARVITPLWNHEICTDVINLVNAITKNIPCVSLACTKEHFAADVMKSYIDSLDSKNL